MKSKIINIEKLQKNLFKIGIYPKIKRSINDIKGIHLKELRSKKITNFTISDYSDIRIYKGSENLYFDINIFYNFDEYFLSIYTKDNHPGLKKLIKEIINII